MRLYFLMENSKLTDEIISASTSKIMDNIVKYGQNFSLLEFEQEDCPAHVFNENIITNLSWFRERINGIMASGQIDTLTIAEVMGIFSS